MPTDSGHPSRVSVLEAASDLRAALAVPADWPRRGRVMPRQTWVPILRRAGWPVAQVEAELPQHEHGGLRAGQRTGSAPQAVTVVPAAWLRQLAARLGVPWAYACRGTVGGE